MFYNLNFSVILASLPFIIKGLGITVFICLLSSFFAFLIGVLVSFLRSQPNKTIALFVTGWVELIRNTPLLIQLYILYKGFPSIGISLPAIACGVVALSFYTGAYISEVIRSGVNSIAKEQIQAAQGLGFNYFQIFALIILPQALRIVIAPLGSQFINLIKNSSLVSFIAVTDIFYVVYKGAVDDFRIVEFFLLGILIYMGLTGIVALLTNVLDKKFCISRGAISV